MQISFKNLKSFDKKTTLNIKKLNVFIGPNSAGKSTLTQAVKYFSSLSSQYRNPLYGQALQKDFDIDEIITYEHLDSQSIKRRENKYASSMWDNDIEPYLYLNRIPLAIPIVEKFYSSEISRIRDFAVQYERNNKKRLNKKYLVGIIDKDRFHNLEQHFYGLEIGTDFIMERAPELFLSKRSNQSSFEFLNFINPNGEEISYLTKEMDSVDFWQPSRREEKQKLIDKNHSQFIEYNKLQNKQPLFIPHNFIESSDIVSSINKHSARMFYRSLSLKAKNVESALRKKNYPILEGGLAHPSSFPSRDGIKVKDQLSPSAGAPLRLSWESYKDRTNGTLIQRFNKESNTYSFQSKSELLDGLNVIQPRQVDGKKEGTIIFYDKKSEVGSDMKNLIENLTAEVFKPLLEVFEKEIPLCGSLSYLKEEENKLILDHLGISHDELHKYTGLHHVQPISRDSFISSIRNSNRRMIFRGINRGRSSTLKNHDKMKNLFSSPVNANTFSYRDGYVNDHCFGFDELSYSDRMYDEFHKVDLSLFTYEDTGFSNHLYTKSIVKLPGVPSGYHGMLSDYKYYDKGNFFSAQDNFVFIDTKTTEKKKKYTSPIDDIKSIYNFLDEVGHLKTHRKGFMLWKSRISVESNTPDNSSLGYFGIKYDSKLLNKGKEIVSTAQMEKISRLGYLNPFGNSFLLAIQAEYTKRVVKNLIDNNIVCSPNFIRKKYKKNIAAMAKKYRISQKSIVLEMMKIDRLLIERMIIDFQYKAYQCLMGDYLKILQSADVDYARPRGEFQKIFARILKKEYSNGVIPQDDVIQLLGDSFESLIELDSPYQTDKRKNSHLLGLQKFINKSLKEMDAGFEFRIRPVMAYNSAVNESRESFHTGQFQLAIKTTGGNFVSLSETGSGNAAIISIISQIYLASAISVPNTFFDTEGGIVRDTSDKAAICIEEPENHLHPNMIAALAKFIFNYTLSLSFKPYKGKLKKNDGWYSFNSRDRLIIETHSEVFLRKIQSLFKDYDSNPKKIDNKKAKKKEDLVNIYYVNKKNQSSKLINLGLKENGFLSKRIPKGFFDINTDLIKDLWMPPKKKAKRK